ncbi:ERF family protein [uncultured Desulfovibrio sp.]|uniref:ERF family protein n=1 Tax=uncultured Desulfovibrio sp. TaxID=167968 RepID=UPI00260479A1|nr:ERF family protein [uncultured Desulfovibrio sp.]
MQEMNSPEITRLAKALLAVQRELASASKDATNPFTRSRYATLNSGMEACREALLTHGIWLTQLPVPAPPELGRGISVC